MVINICNTFVSLIYQFLHIYDLLRFPHLEVIFPYMTTKVFTANHKYLTFCRHIYSFKSMTTCVFLFDRHYANHF